MDENTLYQWSPAGVANNPPPKLPDVAGPSDAKALYRIPGIQYGSQAFDDHYIVRRNTHIPTGTRDLDYRHDDPQLSSGYPLDYAPTSLELGYHNYLPTQDYTFPTAAWMMGGDDYQYIPEPQPEMGMGGGATQHTSVNFQHIHSLTSSDGTTLVPGSSYPQTLGQSRLQDLESVLGDHINVEAMEHTYDTADPTASLLRQQFNLAADILQISDHMIDAIPPILNPKSTSDTIRSKLMRESSMPEIVSYGVENHDESKGSFLKADVISNAEGIISEGKCVRCQVMKIKVCPHLIAACYRLDSSYFSI
jgi:hypothetical protein